MNDRLRDLPSVDRLLRAPGAVLAGALLIGLAFRLRSLGREHPVVHTPREA